MEINELTPRAASGENDIPAILSQLFEKYSVEELSEILLQTLYAATSNPISPLSQQEFAESIHAITSLTHTLNRIERRMPRTIQ